MYQALSADRLPFQDNPKTICSKQCATGSKILTEPELDRIGIILAGPEPDYKP